MNDRGLGMLVGKNHDAYKRETFYLRKVKLDQFPTDEGCQVDQMSEQERELVQLKDAKVMFPQKEEEVIQAIPEMRVEDFQAVTKNLEIRCRDLLKWRVEPLMQAKIARKPKPGLFSFSVKQGRMKQSRSKQTRASQEKKEVVAEIETEREELIAKPETLRNLEVKQRLFLDLQDQWRRLKQEIQHKYVKKAELEEAERDLQTIEEKLKKIEAKKQYSEKKLRLLKKQIKNRISADKWLVVERLIDGEVEKEDLLKVEEKIWNWYIQ